MKNKLLTLLAVFGLSLPAFSQTSDSVQYKNQLGIIGSPSLQYLFQNKSLPVGLIYKRQVKPDRAWRVSVIGSYSNQTFPAGTFNNFNSMFYTYSSKGFWAETLLGYEWQKELSKKWEFYYGIETGMSF